MADIFISYASEDRSRVEPLAKAFEDEGWSVFWDFTIPVGKTWRQIITEALDAAKCAVVVWSSASINSNWVHEEAEEAQERQILVPTIIDKVKPPLGFRRMQAARLLNWAGESNHPEFEKLQKGIEAILGPSPLKVKKTEQKLAEEELRRKQEQERRAAEEKRRKEQKEQERRAAEEKRRKEQEEQERRAAEEKRRKEQKEQERRAAEEKRRKEQEHIKRKSEKPKKIITNNIGMNFVLIPAGSFTMGSQLSSEEIVRRYGGEAEWFKDEQPQHLVEITKPFYLQTTQVSQVQWQRVMESNPSKFKHKDAPVENVSWNDAQKFISNLNKMEGINKYRLPTEAEWEYSCRSETETPYSFGDEVDKLGEYAWYNDNSESQTHHVGKKKPNAWGLYDMHGNVAEWCQDWLEDYPSGPIIDPIGSDLVSNGRLGKRLKVAIKTLINGKWRVLRGGSWGSSPLGLRSASRSWCVPDDRTEFIGFRVARDL